MREFTNDDSIVFETERNGEFFIWLNGTIILKSKTKKQHDRMLSNLVVQLNMKQTLLN